MASQEIQRLRDQLVKNLAGSGTPPSPAVDPDQPLKDQADRDQAAKAAAQDAEVAGKNGDEEAGDGHAPAGPAEVSPTAPPEASPGGGGGGGSTPPPPPDPAAVELQLKMRQRKRAENQEWLQCLGWGIWSLAIAAAVVCIGSTLARHDGSAPAERIDHATGELSLLLTDAQSLLGPAPRPSPSAASAAAGRATGIAAPASPASPSSSPSAIPSPAVTLNADQVLGLRDLAGEIDFHTARIAADAPMLPEKWNGHRMVIARAHVVAHAATLRSASGQLASAAVEGKPIPPAQDALSSLRRARDTIAAEEISPGFTAPWELEDPVAEGFINAIAFTLILLGGLSLLLHKSDGLARFLIGPDGRLSTAQTQAALWTLVVVFLLAHLLFRGTPGRFEQLDETYLLLLGGPYATWVIGGALTRGKVDSAALQKVEAAEAQVRDLVTDDDGRASLIQTQFFAFSMIALGGVLIAFFREPSRLPEIPSGLALLTGTGALAYLGKKAAEKNAPVLLSVYAVAAGPIAVSTDLLIRGLNFQPPGAAGDFDALTDGVTIRFTGSDGKVVEQIVLPKLPEQYKTAVGVNPQEARAAATNLSNEQITVTVPPLPLGTAMLSVVVRGSGAESNALPIVIGDALVITTAEAVSRPGKIRIVGIGLAPRGDRSLTRVGVGTAAGAVNITWLSDTELLADIPAGTSGQVAVVVTNAAGSAQTTAFVPPPAESGGS